MKSTHDNPKRSWIVTLICTVKREVVTRECSKSDAESNPYRHYESERDLALKDWEVESVEPNE